MERDRGREKEVKRARRNRNTGERMGNSQRARTRCVLLGLNGGVKSTGRDRKLGENNKEGRH